MSDATLRPGVFPEGASVGAYAAGPQLIGPPQSAPVTTATVGADGSLRFTGLVAAASYFAAAVVGGEWRYVRFSADVASPGSSVVAPGEVTGADPTGTVDAAPAIQAALTAAGVAAGATGYGRSVHLPGGTYRLGSKLTVPDHVTLWGDGAHSLLRITHPDGASAPNFYGVSMGYRSRLFGLGFDAAVPQSDDNSGAVTMRDGSLAGGCDLGWLTFGDNLYCGVDDRRTTDSAENNYTHIRFVSLLLANLVGVRNLRFGFRLGGGTTQLNGHYLSHISGTAATGRTRTAATVTWPLAAADVSCEALSAQWASSGVVWIGGVRCSYTGRTGNTLNGVTGGATADGAYSAGASVVQGGTTWIETNLADTILLSNFMFQNGDYGWVNQGASGQLTTAFRQVNGSWNAMSGPAWRLGRCNNVSASNVEFNGNAQNERGPQVGYSGSGTPTFVRFDGCLFQNGRGHADIRLPAAAAEWGISGCGFYDGGGMASSGSVWEYAPFVTTVAGGWDAVSVSLPVAQIPPVGQRSGGVVRVGSELIHYTGCDTGTLALTGCTRGAFGSTAATASAGASVGFLACGLLVDPSSTGGWRVNGGAFANQGAGQFNYGLIVAPGGGGVGGADGSAFRANLLDGSYLDGATGANRRWSNLLSSKDSASVASAATLALPNGRRLVTVTGTTTITSIAASYQDREVVLVFSAAVQVTDGGNLRLAGNFAATAGDTLSLICDGTNWIEVCRSGDI